MPELESEKSAEQKRQRLKILTPNQMLSRLKAENNSEKLKMILDNYCIPWAV